MSNDGENILKHIKQTRQLCEQISLLLRTADELMTKANWNSEGNTAISASSASILSPEQWIPIAVFRFYKRKEYRGLLAFISVLLDDHWERKYTIKEPLLTAGFFDYGKAEVKDNDWDYPFARCYGYLSKEHSLKADGEPFPFEKKMLPLDRQGKFSGIVPIFDGGEVFAVPLVSVKNASDVESQITHKLLGRLEKQR